LADEGYVLISGGGLGIGTAAVLGVVAQTTTVGGPFSPRIRVTAFDQDIEDALVRDRLYDEYRQNMIKDAGFAVFLSGNKLVDGSVVNADGVFKEFDVSRSLGVLPIPIGASGHAAELLWHRVRADLVAVFGDDRAQPALDRIAPGRADVDDILKGVFEIISLYDGRRR
jgi:hypothetical protein